MKMSAFEYFSPKKNKMNFVPTFILQLESSKEFRSLMLRMIRCEAEREYEELWKEYNKAIVQEPFVPQKFVQECDIPYTMTPELVIVIDAKEDEVARALSD